MQSVLALFDADPLTPQSCGEFDALIAFDSTTYNRGGPPNRTAATHSD
jgi:hypothetical protein